MAQQNHKHPPKKKSYTWREHCLRQGCIGWAINHPPLKPGWWRTPWQPLSFPLRLTVQPRNLNTASIIGFSWFSDSAPFVWHPNVPLLIHLGYTYHAFSITAVSHSSLLHLACSKTAASHSSLLHLACSITAASHPCYT